MRGLKFISAIRIDAFLGRTPRWVRGLKSDRKIDVSIRVPRRTPRWVRGLKLSISKTDESIAYGRTPRWVRGLKL